MNDIKTTQQRKISDRKKIIAGIAATLMLVIVVLSSFYIARHLNHHCEDHHCPICICIQHCENSLQQMGFGLVVMTAMIIPIAYRASIPLFYREIIQNTPVSQKVRLNN